VTSFRCYANGLNFSEEIVAWFSFIDATDQSTGNKKQKYRTMVI
jgi:hypothetical protein